MSPTDEAAARTKPETNLMANQDGYDHLRESADAANAERGGLAEFADSARRTEDQMLLVEFFQWMVNTDQFDIDTINERITEWMERGAASGYSPLDYTDEQVVGFVEDFFAATRSTAT